MPAGFQRRRRTTELLRVAVAVLGVLHCFSIPWCVSGITAGLICQRLPGLTSAQRRICGSRPDAIVAIGEGARLGLAECRRQFRHKRWNCSLTGATEGGFGHVFALGSREAAFVYAISSAAMTYSVARACWRGNLSGCGCDRSRESTSNALGPLSGSVDGNEYDDAWKWGGCSADVKHSTRLARKFLDAREIEGDDRSLMNLHNNRAGRKAVKFTLLTECKCHGVSGSCTMKTCWKTLPAFSQVGNYVMQRYHKAKRVAPYYGPHRPPPGPTPRPLYLRLRTTRLHPLPKAIGGRSTSTSRRNPNALMPSGNPSQPKRPKVRDLVYLHGSPNYCEPDQAKGSPGTAGRSCNRTSTGTDGCDIMCCGRGYNTHQYTRTWQCNCKFHWCCFVNCDTCSERTEEYTCK
ncbi:protein Wnt-7b-like isoform X2 [Ornithodoros turicata]|uniref:protein Wnt-7b-like isoform X2 n=1 Tax=Ornithodoros turicata TaxID=34597 RepID=UPI003139233B